LSDKREDTYIAGFSMGGYGAIRNGLKYSDNFSKIGMISPALITDDIADYTSDDNVLRSRQFYESIFGDLDNLKGSDNDPKALIESCRNIPDIYMACGEDDFLFEKARDFNEFLKGRNVNATFIEAPGEHTWEFCDKYIKEFIKTL
jgi:S-formylglutathione hydrolase FrmB